MRAKGIKLLSLKDCWKTWNYEEKEGILKCPKSLWKTIKCLGKNAIFNKKNPDGIEGFNWMSNKAFHILKRPFECCISLVASRLCFVFQWFLLDRNKVFSLSEISAIARVVVAAGNGGLQKKRCRASWISSVCCAAPWDSHRHLAAAAALQGHSNCDEGDDVQFMKQWSLEFVTF